MTDFIYDKTIRNKESGLHIDVTVVDTDSDVMVTLKSGCISFPLFFCPRYRDGAGGSAD